MSKLDLNKVTVIYPPPTKDSDEVHALQDIDLTIEGNDFVVALGASGCGKTTLLNVMAGFIQPSGGEVLLDTNPIKGPGADRGVVFQQHALLPWLNVMDNTSFGLMLQKKKSDERKEVASKYLKLVGLEMSVKDRSHFMALAAETMRRVLIDHARAKRSRKRDAGLRLVGPQKICARPSARPDSPVVISWSSGEFSGRSLSSSNTVTRPTWPRHIASATSRPGNSTCTRMGLPSESSSSVTGASSGRTLGYSAI